jgi:hypothetical protein
VNASGPDDCGRGSDHRLHLKFWCCFDLGKQVQTGGVPVSMATSKCILLRIPIRTAIGLLLSPVIGILVANRHGRGSGSNARKAISRGMEREKRGED